MRGIERLFVMSALAAALAGCGTMGMGGSDPAEDATSVATQSPPQIPDSALPSPTSLMNSDEADLKANFGEPPFTRIENTAHIWRYAGAGCQLFFFLYENADGLYRVAHMEARRPGGGASDLNACVKSVARDHLQSRGPVS